MPQPLKKADSRVTKKWPPDYAEEWRIRIQQAEKLQTSSLLVGALSYYATRPHEFINHWCITYDPRNATSDRPSKMPFITFPRQDDLITFLWDCSKDQENGLVEKCRDMGATWVACAFSVFLWRFVPGVSIGWGSRKEDLVDTIGEPDSIFEKMRMIIESLPRQFWPIGFNPKTHMTHMKIINPENGSTITGESGDNIGRGGRKYMYFKDESAHYERPEKVEAALSENTRCAIDISSVAGPGNVFHRRRESGVEWRHDLEIPKGKTRIFVMDYRDHPDKDEAWYNRRKQKFEEEGLLHIFAQEIDRNYFSAVTGVIIPAEWVKSAIDAHVKLKFDDSGAWCAGLDVADEGGDRNALAARKGVVLRRLDDWAGVDVGVTTNRAIGSLTGLGKVDLEYDCIGVGAGVKAESNRLERDKTMPKGIKLIPWNAAASVLFPRQRVEPDDHDTPLNEDFYHNLKAQGWWQLRRRFERTHRAVTKGIKFDPSEMISIDSTIPQLRQLEKELSQATVGYGSRMKLVVNKSPAGTRSPNLADAVVMAYWPVPYFDQVDIGSPVSIGRDRGDNSI